MMELVVKASTASDLTVSGANAESSVRGCKFYDRQTVDLRVNIRMLTVEAVESLPRMHDLESPIEAHYTPLRRGHHALLHRCVGGPKQNRTNHVLCYLDTLVRAACEETTEATARERRLRLCSWGSWRAGNLDVCRTICGLASSL